MEIHVTNLHELAELVSVLDLTRLTALTGVPLRYMPTDGLGREPGDKLERLGSTFRMGADQLIAELKAYPSDDRPDALAGFKTLADKIENDVAAESDAFNAESSAALTAAATEPTGATGIDRMRNAAEARARMVDSTGLPHDTRIHSDPPKTNKDGTWRARRGVDEELVQTVTAELRAKQAEHASTLPADVGVATETHALPVTADGDQDAANTVAAVAPSTTLVDLVVGCAELAGDTSDSLQELLGVAKDFIGEHGTAAFNAVKAAVAPIGEDGTTAKAIPALTPGERRLLRACLDNYALYV